jgi:hypothetical protein
MGVFTAESDGESLSRGMKGHSEDDLHKTASCDSTYGPVSYAFSTLEISVVFLID